MRVEVQESRNSGSKQNLVTNREKRKRNGKKRRNERMACRVFVPVKRNLREPIKTRTNL